MPESNSNPRPPGALRRAADALSQRWQRLRGFVRRHPVLTIGALPAALVLYVAVLYAFTPSIGDIRKSKQEQPSVVLSADGQELAMFKRANRDWVKLGDISHNVVDALLAAEDRRFYDHHGFDARRTAKAILVTLLEEGRQGGSTITQQLARNLYPEEVGRAPTVTRKVKELITALKIEAVYSKDEILETYLNTVPFLYNAYGIEMAARTYFDKSAKELDVLEAATLVGMLKGTAYYNPVLNPDRALQRRNTVLSMMVQHKKLPAPQFERLAKKPLQLDFERQPEFAGPAPHLAQYIRRWLIDWADRNDYNIHADGLVVRTTVDARLQELANKAVRRQGEVIQAVADREWGPGVWNAQKDLVNALVRERPEYEALREAGSSDEEALKKLRGDADFMRVLKRDKTRIQAGFLAIDPNNGHVKAWVGSRDYEEDKFDHVVQAKRQPGSTFKPFVYGAALEAGARPTDTYVDQPVEIQVDRNKVWKPTDIHGSTGLPMTLRDGLVRSKNTITVQVMQQVGPSAVASLARSMGVRQSRLEQVPSIALGTSPVTLREMVAGYATIANGGSYIEPVVVTRVEDRHGNVLEAFHPPAPERALSNDTAQTLIDIMRGVVDEGTAVGMRARFGIPAEADLAGKTGTTQRNTDGWFVAMHPQLVTGAWMGFNDSRIAMRSEYWGQGAHNALFIVGDFLQQAFRTRALDVKVKFGVPKGSTKAPPGGVLDPLWGRVNEWWQSMFPSPNEEAAVAQPAPMPPPPAPPAPLPDPGVIAEPLRLPDSGVLPPQSSRTPDSVLGAPPPRIPDASIAAPSAPPAASPSWPSWPSASEAPVVTAPPASRPGERVVITAPPGGRSRLPQASPPIVIEAPPSASVPPPRPERPPPAAGSAAASGSGTSGSSARTGGSPATSDAATESTRITTIPPSSPDRFETRESVTPAPERSTVQEQVVPMPPRQATGEAMMSPSPSETGGGAMGSSGAVPTE